MFCQYKVSWHNTTFIYLQTTTGEYLIPSSARPDFTGLTNLELYTVDEVIKALRKNFDVVVSNPDENANAGVGAIFADSRTSDIVISIILAILLLAFTLIVTKHINKRHQRS